MLLISAKRPQMEPEERGKWEAITRGVDVVSPQYNKGLRSVCLLCSAFVYLQEENETGHKALRSNAIDIQNGNKSPGLPFIRGHFRSP